MSQSGAIVESYVEAISRPLRTSEEILRFFRLIQPLVGEIYDNNVDAGTSLKRLYAKENPQLGEDDADYCFKKQVVIKQYRLISVCVFRRYIVVRNY